MESQDINVENTGLFDGTIIPNPVSTEDADKESDEEDLDDVISIHMDLIKPLSHLKTLVENIVGAKLNSYTFWLQDSQEVRFLLTFLEYGELSCDVITVSTRQEFGRPMCPGRRFSPN